MKLLNFFGYIFVVSVVSGHRIAHAGENNGTKKGQFLTVPAQEYSTQRSVSIAREEPSELRPSSNADKETGSPNPTPKSVSVSNSVDGNGKQRGFHFTPAEIAELAQRLPLGQSPRKTIHQLANPQEPSRAASTTPEPSVHTQALAGAVVASENTGASTTKKNDAADKSGICCSLLCCLNMLGVRV